jgi:hypothetical protein
MITHAHTNTRARAHTHTQITCVYTLLHNFRYVEREGRRGEVRVCGGGEGGTRRGKEMEGWMNDGGREGGREMERERERDREKCMYMSVQRSPLKSMLDVHACVNTYSHVLLNVCIYEVQCEYPFRVRERVRVTLVGTAPGACVCVCARECVGECVLILLRSCDFPQVLVCVNGHQQASPFGKRGLYTHLN